MPYILYIEKNSYTLTYATMYCPVASSAATSILIHLQVLDGGRGKDGCDHFPSDKIKSYIFTIHDQPTGCL